jgi:hypothetical protein
MKRKSGVDIILALGGHKKPPPGADEEDTHDSGADEEAEGESELDPAFETAWKEYHDHPSAQAFHDAVSACVDSSKDDHSY